MIEEILRDLYVRIIIGVFLFYVILTQLELIKVDELVKIQMVFLII